MLVPFGCGINLRSYTERIKSLVQKLEHYAVLDGNAEGQLSATTTTALTYSMTIVEAGGLYEVAHWPGSPGSPRSSGS